jgi:hypothetical protein
MTGRSRGHASHMENNMFLKPDEYMVCMNLNEDFQNGAWPSMSQYQLKRIHDEAGINVVLEHVHWHQIEKSMGGYDWTIPDKQVDRARGAGMRLLLATPLVQPAFFPDDWYTRHQDGTSNKFGLSIWSTDAQEHLVLFLKKLIERYGDKDTSIIYHCSPLGECMYDNTPSWFGPSALKDFALKYGGEPSASISATIPEPTRSWYLNSLVEWFIHIQDTLVPQHNDWWDSLHVAFADNEHTGNFAQKGILATCKSRYPESDQVLMPYTYWGHSPQIQAHYDGLAKECGYKIVVEADYIDGLSRNPSTATLAIQKGFRGQFVGPIHTIGSYRDLTPHVMERLTWANSTWKASGIK